jgi:hypothetical protein
MLCLDMQTVEQAPTTLPQNVGIQISTDTEERDSQNCPLFTGSESTQEEQQMKEYLTYECSQPGTGNPSLLPTTAHCM